MNSKEALERLYDGYQYGMNGRSLYDIISQDLDRLEKLEKEIIHIHTGYGIELSTEYDKRLELEKENVKLKKAIEILKNFYNFEFNEGVVNYDCDDMCQSFYDYSIDEMSIEKDDYDLLKEVLE